MAMIMAENVIRKACDRCHTQKLSCKRISEDACERCLRLKTECRSSPSLRYKKQLQQQQQHQLQQQYQQRHQQLHQQPQPRQPTPSAETVQIRSRSPKRRRTDSDPSLVLPEADDRLTFSIAEAAVPIVPGNQIQTREVLTTQSVVTPETILDISDFDFNFDQLAFFPTPTTVEHNQYLSHEVIPHHHDAHSQQVVFGQTWDIAQLPVLPAPQTYIHNLPSHPAVNTQIHILSPSLPPKRKSDRDGNSDKRRSRTRTKQRPRQIILRQQQTLLHQTQTSQGSSSTHWMAQLTDINSRLLDLSSALPLLQETAHKGISLGRPTDERFKDNGFPIDEMFKLTRLVADILDELSAVSTNGNTIKVRQARLERTDPANSMFVLSTYVRLLDMYQRVFNLVRTELEQPDDEITFHFWKLPDVTVGSFAVESSPSLQMSLTIQLAEEFLTRLRNATAALHPCLRNGPDACKADETSMFSGVVDVTYQAVKSREDTLGRHLSELRAEIETILNA